MRVVLRNVCKDIKGARVLDNVNLELESGMVYGFKGKNGSGKTMLMRAISGLIMLIYGKEATTQIENSVPYYSVSKWSSNTKMLLLHFHAP